MARKPVRRGSKTIHDVNQLPMFTPDKTWSVPVDSTKWPDFSKSEYIGLDVETNDPNLQEQGPGFIRGDAEVIGISLADENGRKIYLPFGHVEGNLDKTQVISYVKHQLKDARQPKCGANLTYELEALNSIDIKIFGDLCDIQVAEPLLNEEKIDGYSLEVLSKDYLGYGKNEAKLREAAACYGADPKKHMKFLPSEYVGEYAEDDAENPVLIFLEQEQALKADEVWDIFLLEQQLQPILFKMRLNGVRVDLDKAEILSKEMRKAEDDIYDVLADMAGYRINLGSSKHLIAVLQARGLELPTTGTINKKTGELNLSVNGDWLETQDDQFCKQLNEWRTLHKIRADFIEGMILEKHVNGRLHPNWHQLRAMDEEEDGGKSKGTRSGRIASSKPNLTNIPTRSPLWGKKVRGVFVPDHGGKWGKWDYSQQEPRILLHYAFLLGLQGAAEARQVYLDNPKADYHQLTADLVKEKSGKDIGRRNAKDINLGSAYGMGKAKLAKKLNLPRKVADEIFRAYHEGVPYVKKLEEKCMEMVNKRGWIQTILGRKRRFNMWEKAYSPDKHDNAFIWNKPVPSYEEACDKWGAENVARAMVHKALNALVQGSAADQIKKCIIILDGENLTPQIQVYDELGRTVNSDRELIRTQEIMEHAIETTIPFDASPDVGDSWGEVKEYVAGLF